ncbi:polysaccharide deacetylase family protein [Celeribacter indicus]|uniref:Chitooligosaccharide deacetylase n=1 Tax=Celeribacter indicus TaxID=1208324 RepID=A0A0B5E691_9RHOB|nr:polysaccharide deacetylase family protein [Celeribacter indicus]AJE47857.1 polysaccharide deacetylase [Celeribacter indicus]SDW25104.1 Polysaccharide deacetylase [Celeribacter indicus]
MRSDPENRRAPHMLDQDLYTHVGFEGRPPWQPRGAARVAVLIYLYLERFEAEPPEGALFDRRYATFLGGVAPYHRANAFFEYGNRVGIFRVLEVLDRLGLKATVPANAGALAAYPQLVEDLVTRGCEFLAHGEYASRMISSAMPVEEQRRIVRASVAAVERATGRRPEGWMSQDYGQSTQLPGILADEGLRFLCDLSNDEHPYRLRNGMISVPNCSEWSDIEMMCHRRLPTPVYVQSVLDAFEGLHAEGAGNTRVFALHIHPWLSGQPSRFDRIEQMLERLAAAPDVWMADAAAIAAEAHI